MPWGARWATAVLSSLWPALCLCQPQVHSFLCSAGSGNFDAEFRTAVRVHVGAAKNNESGGLASRACAAKLSWGKEELLVSAGASQIDLDAFGADLGDGVPVADFQIKKLDGDCCVDYAIYSLEKPPRLLRTITGGEFFSASDADLDGSVEIWTTDAAAVDGFEKLSLSELDSAPTVVLRFAHRRLQDVSAEFQRHFDEEIARIRATIHPQDFEDFKNSDGRITAIPSPASAEKMHQLRMVKVKVLEIVWNYLYSGREQEGWRSLAEMWPSPDVDRIRAAITHVRMHGIHSQAEITSLGPSHGKQKHARVFDAVGTAGPSRRLEVVPPRGILLQGPPVAEIEQQGPSEPELLLDIVVDRAGKVSSAEPAGKVRWVDPALINAALGWKFVPAFKDNQAVASHLRLAVSAKR
jgi:hypothetical protein